jgi:hypothetical protein
MACLVGNLPIEEFTGTYLQPHFQHSRALLAIVRQEFQFALFEALKFLVHPLHPNFVPGRFN